MQFNVNRSVHDDEGSLQLNDCKFSTSSIKTADVSPRKKYVLMGRILGEEDVQCTRLATSTAQPGTSNKMLSPLFWYWTFRQPGLGMHWPASRRDRAPDRVVVAKDPT
jgi:hypothetical protein